MSSGWVLQYEISGQVHNIYVQSAIQNIMANTNYILCSITLISSFVLIAPLFMGPFIGAVVAIGILLIIIVILACILGYTFWQISHPPHRKQPPNAGALKFVAAAVVVNQISPCSLKAFSTFFVGLYDSVRVPEGKGACGGEQRSCVCQFCLRDAVTASN